MQLDRSGKIFGDRRLIKSSDLYERFTPKHYVRTAAEHGVLGALSFTNILVEDDLLQSGCARYSIVFEVTVVLRPLSEGYLLICFHDLDQPFGKIGQWIHIRIENGDILFGTGSPRFLKLIKLVTFRRTPFDKVQKIVYHSGLGSTPASPEKVYSNPATEFINSGTVLLHLLPVAFRELVSGIVEKVNVFVWISKVAETNEIGLHDFDGLVIRGHGHRYMRIFVRLQELFRCCYPSVTPDQDAPNVSEIAEAVDQEARIGEKQGRSNQSFVPETATDKE